MICSVRNAFVNSKSNVIVSGVFTVDESTGIIYPAMPVTGNMTYHLTVTATDGAGQGVHFDTAKVDINVLSVNKHSPIFVEPAATQHVIEIPEVRNFICFSFQHLVHNKL